jgi:hypothetical protein
MEAPDPPRSPVEFTPATQSNLPGKVLPPSDQIAVARSKAISTAMSVLENPDALANAQRHLESLSKLEALSGLTRRRDTIHGVVILAIVLAAVGLAIGIKLQTVAAAASVTARELAITTTSVLIRTPGTYRSARAIVGGDSGIDASARRALADPPANLSVTEMRQTSDVLRAVLRQESGCHFLMVKEGSLAVGLSSITAQGGSTAVELILRGSDSKPASLTICGELEQPASIAAGVRELTVEQRLNHGVQATEVLPSLLSGELDVGGKRIQLTPLDVLLVRIDPESELTNGSAATIDLLATAVTVRLSANVSDIKVGAVRDRKDRMPSVLESLSRDSPLGTIYTSVLAAFAFLWGLRKVLVA